MAWFDVMQVCLNGHKITAMLRSSPELGKGHCPACGAATISECQKCRSEIQGCYQVPDALGGRTKVPAFCHECGEPYPWTAATLNAARELAEDLKGLSKEEKEALKTSVDDLVHDTPRTTIAATTFKRIVAKTGRRAAEAFKDILVGVISETAKKLVWPG